MFRFFLNCLQDDQIHGNISIYIYIRIVQDCLLILKMKSICLFETSAITDKSTQCNSPGDFNLKQHRCENLKSRMHSYSFPLPTSSSSLPSIAYFLVCFFLCHILLIWYDIFVNYNWVVTGGSSTVHIYTQTIHRTIQDKQYIEQQNNFGGVRAVPRLGLLYPGICLTTEENAQKKLSQGSHVWEFRIALFSHVMSTCLFRFQKVYLRMKAPLNLYYTFT